MLKSLQEGPVDIVFTRTLVKRSVDKVYANVIVVSSPAAGEEQIKIDTRSSKSAIDFRVDKRARVPRTLQNMDIELPKSTYIVLFKVQLSCNMLTIKACDKNKNGLKIKIQIKAIKIIYVGYTV